MCWKGVDIIPTYELWHVIQGTEYNLVSKYFFMKVISLSIALCEITFINCESNFTLRVLWEQFHIAQWKVIVLSIKVMLLRFNYETINTFINYESNFTLRVLWEQFHIAQWKEISHSAMAFCENNYT